MADHDARERLKAALWFAVGRIVDEECLRRNRNATPQFIGALTEMVWTQIGKSRPPPPFHTPLFFFLLRRAPGTGTSADADARGGGAGAENVAVDLESFANHAGRANVTTEDVVLLARRNPDLQRIVGAFVEERKAVKRRG